MRALRRTFPIAIAAIALIVVLSGSWAGVLAALPAIALLAPLAVGRYLGEATIDRLRCTRRMPRRRRPQQAVACTRLVARAAVPRGTALLAFKRAVRPPPVRVLTG